MPELSTDQIEQLDGKAFLAKTGGGDVTLEASEDYSDAFSNGVDLLFGTPDIRIYSPTAISKAIHVVAGIGFVIGNMWAATNRNKGPGFAGLIL